MRGLPLTKYALAGAVLLACLSLGSRCDVSAAAEQDAQPTLTESLRLEVRGNLKGAFYASRRAAAKDPTSYFARLRVAYLELTLKDYAAAAEDYARAATLLPRSVEALLGEQQALIALGRFSEAEPVGREVLSRDADNYLGASRLAWTLFNLRRFAEAADVYSRVLTLYPGDLEMMTGLGYSLLRSGRKPEAAATFRKLLGISETHARARAGLAACR